MTSAAPPLRRCRTCSAADVDRTCGQRSATWSSTHLPHIAGKGKITMNTTIGSDQHQDRFDFHVLAPPAPRGDIVTVFDPAGETTSMLKSLGYTVRPLNTQSKVIPEGVVV